MPGHMFLGGFQRDLRLFQNQTSNVVVVSAMSDRLAFRTQSVATDLRRVVNHVGIS